MRHHPALAAATVARDAARDDSDDAYDANVLLGPSRPSSDHLVGGHSRDDAACHAGLPRDGNDAGRYPALVHPSRMFVCGVGLRLRWHGHVDVLDDQWKRADVSV